MSELRMNAYYYGFDPTGDEDIDLILCAVATAGKAYHETYCWQDEIEEGKYPDVEGLTPVQWIQNAANRAAERRLNDTL